MSAAKTTIGPGRPPLPAGEKATPLHLFLTPARRSAAERVGPTAAQGIYALLDFAQQNATIAAKINAQRSRAAKGTSDA